MAIVYGKSSQYLIRMEKLAQRKARIFSYLITIAVAFISAGILTAFFRELSLLSVALIILVCASLIYLTGRFYRHILESKLFRSGGKGEDLVFESLLKLPSNYIIFRDVVIPGVKGNIDFVVSGPNGIFCIEVKNHRGKITFRNNQLLRNNNFFEKDFMLQINSQSRNLNELLGQVLEEHRVEPVLVFSNPKTWVSLPSLSIQHVHVMHLRVLNNFILKRRPLSINNTLIERVLKGFVVQ